MKTSENLEILKVYSRKELSELFDIKDQTINTGLFKPENHSSVWLFVTIDKTSDRTQYNDNYDGNILNYEGQTKGRRDSLIVKAEQNNDEIIVFLRNKKYEFSNAGFRYLGRFSYISHTEPAPRKFIFQSLDLSESNETIDNIPNNSNDIYYEGKLQKRTHNSKNRNGKARARALKIHGTVCSICGFDFEKYYGEWGSGFIEIHHVNPVSNYEGITELDPVKDLIPVCSNCHKMIHRKKEQLTIEEIKQLVKNNSIRN